MDTAFEQRQLMEFLGHLHRQFAGRTEDEHLHHAELRIDLFNGWHGESRSFAGASLGLAYYITSSEQHRNRCGLNG